MIERGEVLSEIKGYNACDLFLLPAHPNQVGKECSSVLSGILTNPTELTWMKDAKLLSLPLELSRDHFLKEFIQHVQQNNWLKHLCSIIPRLPWFRDNHSDRLLEPSWPMAKEQTCVSNACEQGSYTLSLS